MKTAWRCNDCGSISTYEPSGCFRCNSWGGAACLQQFNVVTPDDIPAAESGDVRIVHHVFEEDTNVSNWHRPSFVNKGTKLVQLFGDGRMWMSNTPDEVRSSYFSLEEPEYGRGQRLIVGGLGIGTIFERLQTSCNPPPDHVVVVEIDQNIIDIVGPTYTSHLPWLEIVHGDIWEWLKTGPKNYFDTAWMDIWACYSEDLLPEMYKLRRQCRRVMRPGTGRVNIWKEHELKYIAKQNTGW